jgi:hypothetical protein
MFTGVFIPEPICKYGGISLGAKMVYGRFCRYAGASGEAYPSIATMGAELGISGKQARRYVRELEHAGLIEAYREEGKVTRYYFLWHAAFAGATPKSGSTTPPMNGSGTPPIDGSRRESVEESHLKEDRIKSDFCPSIAKNSDEQAGLALVRAAVAEFMEAKPAEVPDHIPTEILREAGAPAAEVLDFLAHKKLRYGPGTRHAPREWGWFPTVVRAEFNRRRERAKARAESPTAHWSDYVPPDHPVDWSAIELPDADPPPAPRPHHMEHGGAVLRRLAANL